ncbi:hypothetical protein Tco_0673927 [Tanacetum coccineum]
MLVLCSLLCIADYSIFVTAEGSPNSLLNKRRKLGVVGWVWIELLLLLGGSIWMKGWSKWGCKGLCIGVLDERGRSLLVRGGGVGWGGGGLGVGGVCGVGGVVVDVVVLDKGKVVVEVELSRCAGTNPVPIN